MVQKGKDLRKKVRLKKGGLLETEEGGKTRDILTIDSIDVKEGRGKLANHQGRRSFIS